MDFFERLHDHVAPSHRNAYQPHLLRSRALYALLAVVLVAEGAILFNSLGGVLPQTAAVVQSDIVDLTNTERVRASLGILKESPVLAAAAQKKAEDMAARGYFAHVGPGGEKPWTWFEKEGYDYKYAGENLAVRFNESNEVVHAWMNSPSHKANIVKSAYTEIGIGVAQGIYKGSPATFVVQFFGSPKSVAAAAEPAPIASAPVQPSSVTETEAVQTPVEVAGAETAAAPLLREQSQGQSGLKQLVDVAADPEQGPMMLLWAIGATLALAIGLTFFMHLQIQPTTMLASGTVVAAIAFLFIAFNTQYVLPKDGLPAAAFFAQTGELGAGEAVIQSEL